MSEIEIPNPQDALIAYFDILGYQEFLANNTPEQAAEKVLKTLLGLEHTIPSGFTQVPPFSSQAELIRHELPKIKWLVFADTILLTYETESACGVQDKFFRWIYFLYVCAFLFRRVFDYGLPLRGAITKGRCLIVETVFAGKPILEAHQICSRLNLAGCVITDEALTWAKEGDIDIGKDRVCLSSEWSHLLHYPYMVPEKEGKSSKRQVLNLALFSEAFGNTWDGDLRQIVCSSFGKHNKDKDIKGDVLEKINNTEQYLKFLKNRYPRGFKPKDKAQ